MIGTRRLLVLVAFVFLITSVCAASDIYISQNAAGADTGADCADAYAASFFNNSANWGSGSGQIGPGDTVRLCGTVSTNLTFQGNGSSGNPVILDGTGATMNAYIDVGTSYWTIQNVTWSTSYATNSSNQAVIQALGGWSNGVIQNNHIDVQNSAQVIFMFTGNNMLIKNNYLRIYSPSGDGFDTDGVDWASATNITLQGNYIELNINGDAACGGCHDDIIQVWQYNSNPNPTNATIIDNYFSNVSPGATGPTQLSFCMMEATAGTWNVSDNVFFTTGAGSGDSNGCGWGGSGTYYVYNNTFVEKNGNGGSGLGSLLNGGSGTMHASNNILYRNATGNSPRSLLDQNGATITYNYDLLYSPASGDLPSGCSSQTGNICTTSSTIETGLFNNFSSNDFSLASGSAAIGAGTNLGATYNTAIAPGATWPNPATVTRSATGAWDMGAYQSGTGSPPAPPTGLTASVN